MPEPERTRPVAVAIVGGGAAGLFAALSAARELRASPINGSQAASAGLTGADNRAGSGSGIAGEPGAVVLLEGGSRVGRKLLTTGNGQCNLSHLPLSLANYHGSQPEFAAPALNQISPDKTFELFASIGLPVAVDEAGRVYPWSRQANAVLDLLRTAIARLGVEEKTETRVTELKEGRNRKTGQGRSVPAATSFDQPLWTLACANGEKWMAPAVVIATGGLAAPSLGCGDPYALLLQLGHRLSQPFPALTRIVLDSGQIRALMGIRFNGHLSICRRDAVLAADTGEILFADYGLSGPPVLAVSRVVSEQKDPTELTARLDFIPEWPVAQVAAWLAERRSAVPEQPVAELLHGLLHKKISAVLVRDSGLAERNTAANCTEADLSRLAQRVKAWVLPVRGVRGWPDAQVTAGGVRTADFDPLTLASRRCAGLYAAGEVLDIDGDCGGFNLQWAWSSGWIAGREAARYVLSSQRPDIH